MTLSSQARRWIAIGAINAALAVTLGAFGAHGLQSVLTPKALQTWHTGVDYHGFHALGLLLTGLITQFHSAAAQAARWLLSGILLFSGSLYLLALSDWKGIALVTPIGGLCFIIGWAMLAWQMRRRDEDLG